MLSDAPQPVRNRLDDVFRVIPLDSENNSRQEFEKCMSELHL